TLPGSPPPCLVRCSWRPSYSSEGLGAAVVFRAGAFWALSLPSAWSWHVTDFIWIAHLRPRVGSIRGGGGGGADQRARRAGAHAHGASDDIHSFESTKWTNARQAAERHPESRCTRTNDLRGAPASSKAQSEGSARLTATLATIAT